MYRRGLLLLLLTGILVLAAPPAMAAEVGVAEALDELDVARELVDDSLRLYIDGRAEDAYVAARNAYLDHFELVEIPLRVRNESLTLEVEEDFANLRNLIEAGAPVGEVRATAVEVKSGLDEVERNLSKPGLAAPAIAFGFAFTIAFREGLEAVLVVAAILGYLTASRNSQYKGAVLKGVGAAVIATALTFVLATLVIEIAPVQRELIEAGTALLAVVVLFYVSFWLVQRLEHRRWMEFVRSKVWSAAATGSTLALAGVGFTAVYREGFETVLFYQALLSFAQGLGGYVAAGAGVAVAALGAIGWVIFRAGRKIPIKAFLGTAVVLVMTLSIAFAGNAVRGFQEAALFPIHVVDGLPRMPLFLAQMTGWYPTRETVAVQALLALIYIAGAIWIFVIVPRRRPPAAPGTDEDLATEPEKQAIPAS